MHDPELQGTYTGGCRDGWAEGLGEARGRAHYRGEFEGGRKHGQGVKSWPNGDRYEGQFSRDLREGTGTYVWGRGPWERQRYTGAYAKDRRHGHGVYAWPGGERIEGPWENDRYVGAPTKGLIARSRAFAERAVVVGIPGAKVCREMEIGVASREWVRGTVTAADGDRITIRIDEPGTMGHTLDGVPLRKDTLVEDVMKSWLPCT